MPEEDKKAKTPEVGGEQVAQDASREAERKVVELGAEEKQVTGATTEKPAKVSEDDTKTEMGEVEKVSEAKDVAETLARVDKPIIMGETKNEKHADRKQAKGEKSCKGEGCKKSGKAFRVVALVVAGILILGCGMLTGAGLQRREDNANTWVKAAEDLVAGSLNDDNGSVDLTTDLLLSRLENNRQNGNNTVEIPVDQLVDGSGGGKLVGKVALMPQDDNLTLSLLKLHNATENACYSPLSVRYALEMLRAGANGETKAQIEQLLGSSEVTRYTNVADHMSIANSLWIQNDFTGGVKKAYQEVLQLKYGAEVLQDSFQTATNVNNWIENNSLGMLKNVLQDSDLNGLQTALVNVLAIDMDWEQQFFPEDTSGEYFNYVEGAKNEEYTTLSGFGGNDVYYNLAADATVLAKDLKEYDGTRLQFVAIMPKDDLTSFVRSVDNNQINRLLVGLRKAMAQNDTYYFFFRSYIPKFSMQSGIDDLIADLKQLGVTDAFDRDKADFSNMVDGPFSIDNATHKTNFDFSEEGIKAAAVTIMGGRGAGGDGPIPSSASIVVSINKPFLYFVRDVETGEIWFTGTVYEPNLWKDDKANYKY